MHDKNLLLTSAQTWLAIFYLMSTTHAVAVAYYSSSRVSVLGLRFKMAKTQQRPDDKYLFTASHHANMFTHSIYVCLRTHVHIVIA